MELAYFVHHAMDAELAEFARNLLLEHIDEHDVDHGLDQYVRAVRAHIGNFLNPAGVIVVLHHPELQLEGVGQLQAPPRRTTAQQTHEILQVPDRLPVDIVSAALLRENVRLAHLESVLVSEILDFAQELNHLVARITASDFNAPDCPDEVLLLEIVVDFPYDSL